MPNTIRLRRGSGAPSAGSFVEGEPAWDSTNGKLYIKNAAGTMVQVGGGGGSGTYTVSATAPSTPASGDRWLDSDNGIEYVYFSDGNSSQWVETGAPGIGPTGATGPAVADGDKGDITVSSSGTVWTVDNGAISYAKLQNVSATDTLLGRSSAGAGVVEEITCTAAGRALLDDADAAAQRTTLGLGTLATQSGTFSGTSSGTNTGDQTITLTGDVTGSGTGSFAATLANSGVVAGTYNDSATAVRPFTVDAKGRITGIGSAVTITPGWSAITSTPTTLSGYGITDAATSTHVHGNISNAGAIGTTANLPIITGTSGVLQAGAFGTTANTFCQGNDSRLSDTRTPTDGSVTDAKVASNAAIAFSKLAALTSANILLGNASNVATATAMSGDVTITNAGVTTVTSASTSAAGKVQLSDSVTSTSTSLAATANAAKTAYDIGAKKSISIESPTATEDIILFFTTTAMTLTQIRSVIIGGTSVDFRINYGTDVSAAGTQTTTNAITCNSTTTGVSTTSFSSATIPANNFVWLLTSAVSGTVTQLHVTLVF